MKKLLVLTSNINDYNPKRIKEEAEKLGVDTDLVQYHDVLFNFGGKWEGVWVLGKELARTYNHLILRGTGAKDFNFVRQRDAVVQYSVGKKIRVLNQKLFLNYYGHFDKLMQTVVLKREGLPVIDTRVYGYFDEVLRNERSLPLIMKTQTGSHGSGVKKVVSERGLRYFMGVYPPWSVLFQPFLTSGEDFRVIVIGGRALGVMRRTAREGEYLTNVSAGGRFEAAKLTVELRDLSLKAAKAFHAEFCGVDIMYDAEGKALILEVNKAAEFRGFESCSGVNVAKEMVQYLISSL